MIGLRIRSARSSDVDRIVEMRLSLQEHSEVSNPFIWRYAEERKGRIRQEVEEQLTDENNLTVVAEVEGEIVGFAHGTVQHRTDYVPNDIGWMGNIYVREDFRRKGIGSRLVQEICRFFRSRNIQDVYLRYVLGNKEGEMFWESLGFRPILVTTYAQVEAIEEQLKRIRGE